MRYERFQRVRQKISHAVWKTYFWLRRTGMSVVTSVSADFFHAVYVAVSLYRLTLRLSHCFWIRAVVLSPVDSLDIFFLKMRVPVQVSFTSH